VLPAQQEAQEVLRRDGLDLAAQTLLCVGMDAREQAPRAELLARERLVEAAAQAEALGLEPRGGDLEQVRGQRGRLRELGERRRPERVEVAAQRRGRGEIGPP
jgi:hypothetical protein